MNNCKGVLRRLHLHTELYANTAIIQVGLPHDMFSFVYPFVVLKLVFPFSSWK